MERLLRPQRFATDPNSITAAQEWRHWLKTFQNFTLAVEEDTPTVDKLHLLINYVAPRVFDYIADCTTAEKNAAEKSLTKLFVKPKNEVFARYVLATRRQEPGESLNQFLQALKLLAKDCQFKAMTAVEACDNYVRDAFINGLGSATIRQRLLENKTLDLQSAFDPAHTLETAHKLSASYAQPGGYKRCHGTLIRPGGLRRTSVEEKVDTVSAATTSGLKCFFCGHTRHPCSRCSAREALCMNCKKKGHYAKVC
ncbi:uncharacterized protein [Procambarus clarkii]|uniref:uncharacterized protein n=1 Tax=Procambarus clarkii TaxID=6728 RepID=UPI001E672BF8|nr:uncharacterized protein LOC123749598 [Procambarus clarkii]